MANRPRQILVAVRDLRRAPAHELARAGAIARAARASVELFHAIALPDGARAYPQTALARTPSPRAAAGEIARQALARMARHPGLRGLNVTCTVSWDYPAHEAIIREVGARRADLTVIATHSHALRERLTLRNTDWELVRHCPGPLLLVKSARAYQRPVILAAVDPFHTHARPTALDVRILEKAHELAQLLRGSLHVVHAFLPAVQTLPFEAGGLEVALSGEAQNLHDQAVAREIARFARGVKIPAARQHVQMGDVADVLPKVARRTRAAIVVMGAVSRSALKRFFIGNTAERVLDELTCDVLVVKNRRPLGRARSPARQNARTTTRRRAASAQALSRRAR